MTNQQAFIAFAAVLTAMACIFFGVNGGDRDLTRIGLLGIVLTCGFIAWTVSE